MNIKKALITLILVVFVTISCVIFFFHSGAIETKEFKMYLTVGNYAGFNVDTDAIYFGTIFKSGSGSRNIILTNDYKIPLKVSIQAFGELADWVYVSDNNFILEPYNNESIKVNVVVPKNAEFGNYTGVLRINFIR